jgi:glycosyltransferase involved in cell wall biosynthesis
MSSKKDIVIINQDSGYLMIDLANAYSLAGYNVSLVAGRLVQRDKALAKDICLKKIIKFNRTSTIKRLLTWCWGTFEILVYIILKCRNKHLLFVSNPPFANLVTLFVKNPFSLLIYDVWPDALTEFGVFSKHSIFVKWWQKSNIKVFGKAKRIITLTPGMKNLLMKYSGAKAVEVLPIWTDNKFLRPIKKESNKFVHQHNLAEKFVVMYSGNLGYTHDVEVLVDLAAKIKDKDIQIIIIGEGDKREILQKKIVDSKLDNCTLLPFQSAEDLPFSLASADIAVVTLGKDASKLSIPSKTYNLMSVGAPLLCIAEENSELNNLIGRYQIGQCFRAYQLEAMYDFIMELKQSPQKHKLYASNSLKASKDFGPENIYKFIDHHVH